MRRDSGGSTDPDALVHSVQWFLIVEKHYPAERSDGVWGTKSKEAFRMWRAAARKCLGMSDELEVSVEQAHACICESRADASD